MMHVFRQVTVLFWFTLYGSRGQNTVLHSHHGNRSDGDSIEGDNFERNGSQDNVKIIPKGNPLNHSAAKSVSLKPFQGRALQESTVESDPSLQDANSIKRVKGIANSDDLSNLNATTSSALKYLATFIKDEIFQKESLCTGVCGEYHNHMCSCRPSCVAMATCCIDFFDACVGDVYSLEEIETDYAWLRHVDKECFHGQMVVSSCPSNSRSAKSDLDNGTTNKTKEELIQLIKLTRNPLELMQLLAMSKGMDLGLEQELEWIFSRLGLEDTSSDISFRNYSTFHCNARPWELAVPFCLKVPFKHKKPAINTENLKSLLLMLDKNTSYSTHPIDKSKRLYTNHPCYYDVISTCPSWYADDTLKFYCEHTTLGIILNTLSESPRSFKNPFCMLCHLGLKTNLEISQAYNKMDVAAFAIEISVSNEAMSLSNPTFIYAGKPAWEEVVCKLETHGSHRDHEMIEGIGRFKVKLNRTTGVRTGIHTTTMNTTTMHTTMHTTETLIPASASGTTRVEKETKCVITKCASKSIEQTSSHCHVSSYVGLLLPPSSRDLNYFDIDKIFEQFTKQWALFMGESWYISFTDDLFSIIIEEYEFQSLKFQYFMTRMMITNNFLFTFDEHTPWHDLPKFVWSNDEFPFLPENFYFCMTLSRFPITRNKVYSRANYCWDMSSSTVSNSSSTTQPSKDIGKRYGKYDDNFSGGVMTIPMMLLTYTLIAAFLYAFF